MVNWNNVKLVFGDNTLEHIAKHRVNLYEVQNVLGGYFIPYRINVGGVLRYLVIGESYGRVLTVILEPAGTNEMRLLTAFDATESRRKLYRAKKQKVTK